MSPMFAAMTTQEKLNLRKQMAYVRKHGEYKSTPEDQALIDEAIKQGRVTYCPPCTFSTDINDIGE